MEFSDFSIEIDAIEDKLFAVKVRSTISGEREATFTLSQSVDELVRTSQWSGHNVRGGGDLRAFSGAAETAPEQPTAIGQELFDMLFSSRDIYSALAECVTDADSKGKGVRLRLKMNMKNAAVRDLARLPWELLHDKSKYQYFGQWPDFSISRYLEVPKSFEVTVCRTRLRILVVSSNPRKDLALDKELDNLKKALGDNPNIDIDFLEAATIQKIDEKLAHGKKTGQKFHVLHYMGHGDFHNDQGVLLLHKEDGGEDYVEAETFNTALQASDGIRLVFLNACNTAESSGQEGNHPFAGVATALVFGGVPAVVAMQRPVPDSAAIVLSKAFYSNIARGVPVDAALSEGRRQMFYHDRTTLDWAIPVLFMRSPNGVLFDFAEAPQPPDGTHTTENPQGETPEAIQKRPLAIIAAAGVLVIAIVAAAGYYFFGREGTVTVPAVRSLSQQDATEKLKQAKLGVKVEEAKDDRLEYGAAIRTSPEAGESSSQNGVVTLYVSGMKTLPKLDDELSKDKALDKLKEQGFDNVVVKQKPDPRAEGTVLGTEPSAGVRVLRTDPVTLIVAGSKTEVPKVVGLPISEAQKLVKNANLNPNVVKDWKEGATLDTVIRTEPGPETQADRAASVTLFVSATGGWVYNGNGVLPRTIEKDQKYKVRRPGNLRKEPNDSAQQMGAVQSGQSVRVLEVGTYDWVKVVIDP
jgi:beta-lactam-binding protein with PASTA domain